MDLFDLMDDSVKIEPYDWMKTVTLEMINTEERMIWLVDQCIKNGRYSLDLETNGLDTRVFNGETRSKIVGICISPDRNSGYYIPIRHKDTDKNLSYSVANREMVRLTSSKAVAIFHNAKFDQELLQNNGGESWGTWDDQRYWEDTIILAYLINSRARQKGLKFLSKTELDMEMIELHELYGHEKKRKNFIYDFSSFDPSAKETVWYAAGDAICTYRLWEHLHPQVIAPKIKERKQSVIYAVEKACLTATRFMERCRVQVDVPKVKELIAIGQKELFESLKEVYDTSSENLGRDITPLYFYMVQKEIEEKNPTFEIADDKPSISDLIEESRKNAKIQMIVDRDPFLSEKSKRIGVEDDRGAWPAEYDVMSAQQLGKLLDELKVPYLQKTEASGQVKTSKGALDEVLEKAGSRFPWLGKIKRFREVQKALSTYLLPLYEDREPSDDTIKVNFNGLRTDTGRFSVKSGNFQKEGGCRFPFHGTPSTYDPSRPECLARIRECVVARENKFIVAIDFSGEELRIVTNLSGEPMWLNEFFRCSGCDTKFDRGDGKSTPEPPPAFCPNCGSDKIGDLHTLTCISVYGESILKDPKFKAYRGYAKGVNFALSYGGSGKAVVRTINCDENEGHRIKDKFDKTYTGLTAWWNDTKRYAKKYGFVKTAWGRVYPVPDIKLPRTDPETGKSNWSFISKAERNSVNGPVQGTGSDIIKIAMAKCYSHIRKMNWEDKCYMIATMHDELVFEIDGDILEQAIDDLEHLMTSNPIIMSKKWTVPFTTDVEIGKDWTVPWDLSKMRNGKKPFCDELKPLFKKVNTDQAPKEQKKETTTVEEESESKDLPFYKYELGEISAKLVYEIGDKLSQCVGDTPLLLTHKGETIPMGVQVTIDVPKFKELFE
jgi:DNA polymerase I-like protein with 3'-5' exonuclease and polymerase domains